MLEVRLLGSLEASLDGSAVRMPGKRLPALLAILALAAGSPVSFDTLAERLWGNRLPREPRATLHTYISRLRSLLGAGSIITSGDEYSLRVGPEHVDALWMADLVAQSATAGVNEREVLQRAVALWLGEPFQASVSEWLSAVQAPRLAELYLSAVERRIDLDLADRSFDGLMSELQDLTDRYPLREPLWARRIRALAMIDRRAEALELYGVVREMIADELGVEPGPELQRIHRELLAADELHAHVAVVPRQLPLDVRRFTGRQEVLGALDELLEEGPDGRPVIAAVHGAGGAGKSSTVVHWAHRVRDRFPAGQIFVELRGHGADRPLSPARAVEDMLRSLGVRPDRIPADPSARSALFRSTVADRRLLIVLDNARDTAQVRPLLPGAGPMVVVTSRTRLAGLAAREEARGIAVGRLSRHESVELLTAALRQDEAGVRDPLLGELATLCDCLPLALVIAADQIAGGRADLRQLIGDLRDRQARLDVLDSGDDPLSSLRATLTSSYDVLDPAAARLFRLLGEHPGADFEIGAAMALGGSGMTVPVTRLTDAHLVEQHRPGRFRLHDLVKQFAADVDADSAAAAEREPALDRLLAWYLHSAVAATRALGHGPPSTGVGAVPPGVSALTFDDTTSARAWFADERANLAAAVRHAAERGRHRALYGITQALSVYLSYEASIDEARELQQIAIRSAQAEGDDRAIADLLRQLGSIYIRSGRHPDAIGTLRKSAAHWSRAGDDRGLAATHATLGMAYQATGRHAEALPLLYEGLDHARRTGAIDEQVRTLNNLAMSHIGLERFDVAMETVQEAFALLPDADGRWVEPYLWDTLGQAHAGLKEYGEAIAAYRKALELTRRVGERWGEPPVLHHLGLAQRAAGATADARASWEAALRLMAEAGTGQPYRPELLRLISTLGS